MFTSLKKLSFYRKTKTYVTVIIFYGIFDFNDHSIFTVIQFLRLFNFYGFQVMAGYGMGMAITRKENTHSNLAFNSNNNGNINSNTNGIFSTVTGNKNSNLNFVFIFDN